MWGHVDDFYVSETEERVCFWARVWLGTVGLGLSCAGKRAQRRVDGGRDVCGALVERWTACYYMEKARRWLYVEKP